MNSKNIWVGVSLTILTAIAQAQVVGQFDECEKTAEEQEAKDPLAIVYVRPESNGGATVVKCDGDEIYFTKEQIEAIKRIKGNGKGKVDFRGGVFCARKVN